MVVYEYKTLGIELSEKFIGKTKVSSGGPIAALAGPLNALGEQGWELVNVNNVPVVGKMFKSRDRRDIAVAFLRRPKA